MGCDIHVCFEQNVDGVWHNIDNYQPNEYYNEEVDDGEPKFYRIDVYRDRNYWLFAILADVRSYGDDIKCMSQPKGIPADADEDTIRDHEMWSSDAHSASYHTLYDLVEWNKKHNPLHGLVVINEENDEYKDLSRYQKWEFYAEIYPLEFLIDAINKRIKSRGDYDVDNPEVQKSFRIVFWFDN